MNTCSSLCHKDEPCSITADGKCDASQAQQEPENPLDMPLPCDIRVGHVTIGKGCKLSVLVRRMNVLYEMAASQAQQPTTMAAFTMLQHEAYKQGVESAQAQQPTDLSEQLREYAGNSGYSHNDYADTMLAAASEIERLTASQAQQPTNIQQIVKNAILANSHPAEDWHLAFSDAEEIDIVANQVAIALPNEFGDPYQGAREDLAIWKKRALEAESKLQSQTQQEPVVYFDNAGELVSRVSIEQVEVLLSNALRKIKPSSQAQQPRNVTDEQILQLQQEFYNFRIQRISRQDLNSNVRSILSQSQAQQTESQWISVEERLPEKYENVLVYPSPTEYVLEAHWDGKSWVYGYYEHHHGHVYETLQDGFVTHWMPLPPAPEGEKP